MTERGLLLDEMYNHYLAAGALPDAGHVQWLTKPQER
jgi:hypothetical protein